MRPSPVQMFVGEKRVAAGRVPRKYISGIVIRMKASFAPDGVATFPCPFCMQTISTGLSTSCSHCESDFDYQGIDEEITIVASRSPTSPLI